MSQSDTHWPDGTPRSQANAFTLRVPITPAIRKIEHNAAKSRRSTATVVRNLASGKNLSAAGAFSARSASSRYSAPVVGRVAGEKQRDRTSAIRKASI